MRAKQKRLRQQTRSGTAIVEMRDRFDASDEEYRLVFYMTSALVKLVPVVESLVDLAWEAGQGETFWYCNALSKRVATLSSRR